MFQFNDPSRSKVFNYYMHVIKINELNLSHEIEQFQQHHLISSVYHLELNY